MFSGHGEEEVLQKASERFKVPPEKIGLRQGNDGCMHMKFVKFL